MRRFTGLMAILFVLSLTAAGWAGSDVPDLKGTWVVKASGHKFIKPGAPSSVPQLQPEGFHQFEFPMVIDRQDGFRFSGSRQPFKSVKRRLSGVIGFDNQSVYMVDDEAAIIGKLVSPDKMECIYLEASKTRSIASREIITRKR